MRRDAPITTPYPRRSCAILTVAVGDRSAIDTIASLGFRVLQVRYPLPACARILATRPLVVVVDRAVREVDREVLARAASEVEATLIDAAFADRRGLLRDLHGAIETACSR